MPDHETQRAINDTLRNVRSQIQDQYARAKRRRDADATESPILSERMHAYSLAMQIVNRFIEPNPKPADAPDA